MSRKFPEAPVTRTLLKHLGREPLGNMNVCFGAKWDHSPDVLVITRDKTTKKKIIFV